MKKYTPAIAKKFSPIAAAADDSRGSRNNLTSRDGYSVLDSCTQNTVSTASPAAIGPMTPRSSHEPASRPADYCHPRDPGRDRAEPAAAEPRARVAAPDDPVDEQDKPDDRQQHA